MRASLKTNTDRRLVVRASAARLVEWLTAEVAVEAVAAGLARRRIKSVPSGGVK